MQFNEETDNNDFAYVTWSPDVKFRFQWEPLDEFNDFSQKG